MSFEAPLCRLEDIVDGDARGCDSLHEGRDTVFVVYAWRDSCPHERGTPMAWRKNAYLNAERGRIACHAHGALFAIASGLCLLGPIRHLAQLNKWSLKGGRI